jgi:NitT/TauT family transport system permease protein
MTEARRPEIHNTITTQGFAVQEAPRSRWQKLYDSGAFRKTFLLVVLMLVWEMYARVLDNALLFPTFSATVGALLNAVLSGELPQAAAATLLLLFKGYVAGLLLAAVLTAFASMTRIGADILETLTAMFNPLPSIALLPLALIWFGLGDGSIIFVLIHAVLWAVALNAFTGFKSVSPTLRMVGRNYGLTRAGFVIRILIPGAFPSILTGLKIGWAFAWRTLIAAELVFGVSSGSGGLGWFIYQSKNQLEIPEVFAGLLTVILFGLFVENLVFRVIENRTVRRWGMAS